MSQMRIKAIAWDIDGTLIDSEPLHENVLIEVCDGLGVDLSDLPPGHFKGVHMDNVWLALESRFAGRVTKDRWASLLKDRYVERAPELLALPCAVEVMRELGELGLRQVCVSNSGRHIVDANLRALGVEDMIEFSMSLDDVTRGKPDPFPYAEAARRLDLAPEEVAAVEDSPTGVKSALAAGLHVFGIAPDGTAIEGAAVTMRGLDELRSLVAPPPTRIRGHQDGL